MFSGFFHFYFIFFVLIYLVFFFFYFFVLLFFFFFFQAEDGIRDHCVTGVQTCALPISIRSLDSPSIALNTVAAAPHGRATPSRHRCARGRLISDQNLYWAVKLSSRPSIGRASSTLPRPVAAPSLRALPSVRPIWLVRFVPWTRSSQFFWKVATRPAPSM